MALKSLLVHLDQSERSAVRLALAVTLARQHQAHLVGAFAQRALPEQVGVVASWPSAEYTAAAQQSRLAFERETAGLPGVEWIDVNRGSDAALLQKITELSRYADLAILGQTEPDAPTRVPPELPEEVLLNAGRPILVVPYAGQVSQVGRHPLIAWNDSAESARAVADAIDLIGGCQRATVIAMETRAGDAEQSSARLVDFLARHGIPAKAEVTAIEDIGVMDLLLSRVSDLDADLLVMGGHGAFALPFLSRGAGTRYILQHMVVPVLMSN